MPVGSSNSAHDVAENTNQKAGPIGRLFGFSGIIQPMQYFMATDEHGWNTAQVGRVLETRDSVNFHSILGIFMTSILAGRFWLKRAVIVDKMIAAYLSRFSTSLSSARSFFNA